jgi:hypothetical protein
MSGHRTVLSIDAGQSILGDLELGKTAKRRQEELKGYNIGRAIARIERRGEVCVCVLELCVCDTAMSDSAILTTSMFRGTKSCLHGRMRGRTMTTSRSIVGILIACAKKW